LQTEKNQKNDNDKCLLQAATREQCNSRGGRINKNNFPRA